MSHCRNIATLSRHLQQLSVLLRCSGACTQNLRHLPVRALSTTRLRLQHTGQTDGQDGRTQTQETQGFHSQQFENSSTSESDDSSSDQSEEGTEYEHNIKQRILEASLIHVHEFGWTKKALEAGAASEGLPPVAQGMFPRGGAELVHYFYTKSNEELATILKHQVELGEQEGQQQPRGKPFIRDAVETRLRMIVPYIDNWPQAMAIQAMPQNAVQSWTNLLTLADEIWYYAGDRSVDFNWYTKRVALAGVYKSSEIFMIQDKSQDFQDTLDFMDRRLKDFQSFGANKKKLEQCGGIVKEGLEASFILGRNILGMNSRNR